MAQKTEEIKISAPQIQRSLIEVMRKIAQKGIPKDLKISFKTRNIPGRSTEIIVQSILPMLIENNITLTFQTKSVVHENSLWLATVEYTLTSAIDNSSIVSTAVGSAPDGDRPIQNAMTYAFKNFFTQIFLIAEGGNDEEPVQIQKEEKTSLSTTSAAAPVDETVLMDRAQNKRDELKVWLSQNADNPNKQIEFGQKFYSSINHPKFPEHLRSECINYLTEYNIANKVII